MGLDFLGSRTIDLELSRLEIAGVAAPAGRFIRIEVAPETRAHETASGTPIVAGIELTMSGPVVIDEDGPFPGDPPRIGLPTLERELGNEIAVSRGSRDYRGLVMLTLEKWYADVVAADGSLAIGYAARLVTRHGSLAAASLLTCGAEGHVGSRTFGRGARVFARSGELRLTHPAGWRGVWSGHCPAYTTNLHEEPGGGAVTWECCLPAATASVSSDGWTLSGCGYAEKLTVTVEPWRLPIDVLRWGRFVTPRSSVVWLSWEGPHPLTLVLLDGVPVEPATVSEGGVVAANLELEITGVSELRSGRITSTVLKPLRALARLVPLRTLGLEETKWRGRAVLRRDGAVVDEGFTIHEVVRWPRG